MPVAAITIAAAPGLRLAFYRLSLITRVQRVAERHLSSGARARSRSRSGECRARADCERADVAAKPEVGRSDGPRRLRSAWSV